MDKEHRRNDTDRETRSARRTSCRPSATCLPEFLHRLPLQHGSALKTQATHNTHTIMCAQTRKLFKRKLIVYLSEDSLMSLSNSMCQFHSRPTPVIYVCRGADKSLARPTSRCARVGTLIVAPMYLQLIQNRYMFRSFTVLQCSHQHCVQPVASDVEVVGYL